MPDPVAAESLLGLELPGGWTVDEKVARPPTSTGGNFSVGYLVSKEKGSRKGYLKALDFSSALEAEDLMKEMAALTTGFHFEREILELCQKKKLDRVVTAIDSGIFKVTGPFPIKQVPFLIFELADGDIRARFDIDKTVDIPWCLRSLHHIATGLGQLHGQGISHQDMKPSNALVFKKDETKVADLGRAVTAKGTGPFDNHKFAGDKTYSPPEFLYGYFDPEWTVRRLGCDAYHLGSLILFFFSKVSTTPAIITKLAPAHSPHMWGGSFQDVLPYLTNAFDLVLADFRAEVRIIEPKLENDLTQLIRELCDPDPKKRGDPAARNRNVGNPFSLERYITRLDRLAQKALAGIL